MNKQPISELSLDAQLIRDRLYKAEVGETVTFAELDELIGRDVRKKAISAMNTARKHALKNRRVVFTSVHGVGIKRMTDVEVVDGAACDVKHIRRSARRAAVKLTTVDFGTLPNEKKVEHNAQLSVLGVIDQFSSKSALTLTKARVQEASEVLPVGRMLEAFK